MAKRSNSRHGGNESKGDGRTRKSNSRGGKSDKKSGGFAAKRSQAKSGDSPRYARGENSRSEGSGGGQRKSRGSGKPTYSDRFADKKSRQSDEKPRRSSGGDRYASKAKSEYSPIKKSGRPSFDDKKQDRFSSKKSFRDKDSADFKRPKSDFRPGKSSRSFDDKDRGSSAKRSFRDKDSFDDRKPKSDFRPGKSGRSFDDKDRGGSAKRSFRDKDSFDDRKPKSDFTPRKSGRSSFGDKKQDSSTRRPFRDKDPFGDAKSRSEYPKKSRKPSFDDKKPDRFSSKKSFSDKAPFSEQKRSKGTSRGDRSESEGKYVVDAPEQTEKIRLNRFIANSGVCSRREADELITMGLISVNGKTITELGYKVNPGDEVRYEDRLLRAERPVYILLNKPKGYLTTTSDPQERNTVMHLVANAVKERIYPVGRLDRNTTGLLLLTNDGELAEKLMHPSYNIKKIYKVELDRPITKGDLQRLLEGVDLEEGKAKVDDAAIVSEDGKTVGIELHIGWNRVVRRMFEAMGYEVEKLDRSVYAGLDKKDLPRGHWRFLRKEEIVRLKHYK